MSSLEEIGLAVSYGADAVGLVSAMPSGPGPIPDELARDLAAHVPPTVASFLLTSRQSAAGIIEQQRRSLRSFQRAQVGQNRFDPSAIRGAQRR